MNTRWKVGCIGLVLTSLVACSSGGPAPTPPDLTEKNAWTGDFPADAEIISSGEFTAGLLSGDLSLISSADLAAQKAARDQQFQQDKSFLQALPNKSPDVQALLAEAASVTAADTDPSVKLPDGQTVIVDGLSTQLRNAVLAEQLDQDVNNALSDYRMIHGLLPDSVKAQAPNPTTLNGKPLADVRAALDQVNGLLSNQPSLVRPEPNGGALRVQAITPGNGTDEDSPCSAPTNYVKTYWFPLKDFVSPVKRQGNRGTCWAFTAIGAVESRERVQNGNAVNLSEQFLVNKVKQGWDAEDYHDGYWAERALNTATDKGQQLLPESGWTYNASANRGDGNNDDAASFHNSCDNYTGTCSDTTHQSRRKCTTVIFKFCSYVNVTFKGPGGVAPAHTTLVWKSGNSFNVNNYRLLLNQGHVLIASMNLYRGFKDDVGSDGVVSIYSKTRKDAKGNYVSGNYGGHALLIVGFLSNQDLSTPAKPVNIGGGGYFIVKNQWGCGVADGGYYYVPADYVQQTFKSLSSLDFDTRRSDAWTKAQGDFSIAVPNPSVQVDLRVETDLAEVFKVRHPSDTSVNLTVTSDKDGTVYSGPWSTDPSDLIGPVLKYTFTTAGSRRFTVTAQYGSRQVNTSFTVNVVNTPPALTLSTSGDAHQNEPYQITAVIADKNESNPTTLCAATTWSVTAPDALSTTTGCRVSVTFGTTGTRTVTATTRDSDGAVTSKTLTLTVQPPSVNPYPIITDSGVYPCAGSKVGNGSTLNLTDRSCSTIPYTARVTVDNPSSEPLTYDWALLVSDNTGEHVYIAYPASKSSTFQMYDAYNSGPTTTPCRVTVKVNAPDAGRSKGQTVWSGNCTYHTFSVN